MARPDTISFSFLRHAAGGLVPAITITFHRERPNVSFDKKALAMLPAADEEFAKIPDYVKLAEQVYTYQASSAWYADAQAALGDSPARADAHALALLQNIHQSLLDHADASRRGFVALITADLQNSYWEREVAYEPSRTVATPRNTTRRSAA